jgi:hypothetical protein
MAKNGKNSLKKVVVIEPATDEPTDEVVEVVTVAAKTDEPISWHQEDGDTDYNNKAINDF